MWSLWSLLTLKSINAWELDANDAVTGVSKEPYKQLTPTALHGVGQENVMIRADWNIFADCVINLLFFLLINYKTGSNLDLCIHSCIISW